MVPISILDQSPVRAGTDPAQAISETRNLARFADRLGYKRYWLAEHHNTSAFAGPAPEILINQIANETQHIRVGSGGVMMTHYAPLKIAETFRMLETLHPGRIDLGVGRAPGADGRTAGALQSGPQAYDISVYPQLLDLLVRYLNDANGAGAAGEGFEPSHPYHGLRAMPTGTGFPEIWVLGSGIDSALIAAEQGHAFAHAHFINPDRGDEIVATYRERFKPSAHCLKPKVAIGVSALAAETEEEAKRLAKVRNLWGARLLTGQRGPFPSLQEAENHSFTAQEAQVIKHIEARGATGTPTLVRDRLLEWTNVYGAEELFIVTITHDHEARRRSYELLAEAFDLKSPT